MSHFDKVLLKDGLTKDIILANSNAAIALKFVEQIVTDGKVRGWSGEVKEAELVFRCTGDYDIGFIFPSETEVKSIYHHDDETKGMFCQLKNLIMKKSSEEEGKKTLQRYLENKIKAKVNVTISQPVG